MRKPTELDRPELEKKYLELLEENHALKIFVMKLAAAVNLPFTNPEDLQKIEKNLEEILAAFRRRSAKPDAPVMLQYDHRSASTADLIDLDDKVNFMTDRQRELVELLHANISHSEIKIISGVRSISSSINQLLLKYFKIREGIKKPRYGRYEKYKLKTEKTLPEDDDKKPSS